MCIRDRYLVEAEAGHEVVPRVVVAAADDADDLVDVVLGDEQALEMCIRDRSITIHQNANLSIMGITKRQVIYTATNFNDTIFLNSAVF